MVEIAGCGDLVEEIERGLMETNVYITDRVDFQAEGYNLTGLSNCGIFLSDFTVRCSTSIDQVCDGVLSRLFF